MIKEMSYFVRRGPPLVVTGHRRVKRKLIVLRKKKRERGKVEGQRGGSPSQRGSH